MLASRDEFEYSGGMAKHTERDANMKFSMEAPKGQELIARGVSPWNRVQQNLCPEGATVATVAPSGLVSPAPATGGLRPWLLTAGPPGLKDRRAEFDPEGVAHHSPGSRRSRAPWGGAWRLFGQPCKGCIAGLLFNPITVVGLVRRLSPGCAASRRPWAGIFNPVGV